MMTTMMLVGALLLAAIAGAAAGYLLGIRQPAQHALMLYRLQRTFARNCAVYSRRQQEQRARWLAAHEAERREARGEP